MNKFSRQSTPTARFKHTIASQHTNHNSNDNRNGSGSAINPEANKHPTQEENAVFSIFSELFPTASANDVWDTVYYLMCDQNDGENSQQCNF